MADPDRLVRLFCLVLLALIAWIAPKQASATITPSQTIYYIWGDAAVSTQRFSSAAAACTAPIIDDWYTRTKDIPSDNWSVVSVQGVTQGTGANSIYWACRWSYTRSLYGSMVFTDGSGTIVQITETGSCPANSTLSNGTCVCSAGYVEEGGACVIPNPCAALQGQAPNNVLCTGASCAFYAGSSSVRSACLPLGSGSEACTVSGDLDIAWFDSINKLWGIRLETVRFTGASCNASDPTLPVPGDTSAPNADGQQKPVEPVTEDRVGKCPGVVNGVTMWVPCTWTTSSDKKSEQETTTNPDGTTTTKDKETTSTTECKDGKCVTTTVTSSSTNGTATTSTTASSGAAQSEYCKANPKDPQCEGTSSFSGSCTAGFSCTGDAVMCATARAMHQQKCALVDQNSAESNLFASEKAKPQGAGQVGIPGESIGISQASFDQSNALGVAGSCSLNKTVTIWGQSVTLPFDQVCGVLEQLGSALVVIGFLLAIRIVGRG